MTAPFNDRLTILAPAGGTTSLTWDFMLMADTALVVIRKRSGVEMTLTLGVDYSFPSGLGGDGGGTLLLATPSLADDIYVLVGAAPEQRTSDFVTSQPFATPKHNAQLDDITRILQEHRRDLGRAWKSNYGENGQDLPGAAERATKLLAFDDLGDPIAVAPSAGGGDMMMSHMIEGPNAKIMTAAERARIEARALTSKAQLNGLDRTLVQSAYVNDGRRSGPFEWVAGDLSGFLTPIDGQGTTTVVNAGTDTCTKAAHRLWTGQAFIATTSVNGLTADTIYWSIRVDVNNFKVAASFEDAHAGTAIDLTGTTNFTFKRLLDPRQGVYVIPPGLAIDGSQGAWVRQRPEMDVSAHWFGYEGQAVAATNDAPALQAAIYFAAGAVDGFGGAGVTVNVGTGVGFLGQMIWLANRVAVRGSGGGRGTLFRLHSSFAQQYMFYNINTETFVGDEATPVPKATFGSRIDNCTVDARGKNLTAVIRADAWQETCGMDRTLIMFNGTTQFGLLLAEGHGGASGVALRDIEIMADSTNVNAAGIRVTEISSVGASVINLSGICSIVGSVANTLANAISVEQDTLVINGTLHVEMVTNAVNHQGKGAAVIDTITGSFNAVTNLIALASGFTGRVSWRCLFPNGASGNSLNNAVTGRHIAASEGIKGPGHWPITKFRVGLSGNLTNLTGNGATPVVLWDSVGEDDRGAYTPATGFFAAPEAGTYLFTASAQFGPIAANTTYLSISLVTPSATVILWRGDPEAIRDNNTNNTFGGSALVHLTVGQAARIVVTAGGLAGNTIGILSSGSHFAGCFVGR